MSADLLIPFSFLLAGLAAQRRLGQARGSRRKLQQGLQSQLGAGRGEGRRMVCLGPLQ